MRVSGAPWYAALLLRSRTGVPVYRATKHFRSGSPVPRVRQPAYPAIGWPSTFSCAACQAHPGTRRSASGFPSHDMAITHPEASWPIARVISMPSGPWAHELQFVTDRHAGAALYIESARNHLCISFLVVNSSALFWFSPVRSYQ